MRTQTLSGSVTRPMEAIPTLFASFSSMLLGEERIRPYGVRAVISESIHTPESHNMLTLFDIVLDLAQFAPFQKDVPTSEMMMYALSVRRNIIKNHRHSF